MRFLPILYLFFIIITLLPKLVLECCNEEDVGWKKQMEIFVTLHQTSHVIVDKALGGFLGREAHIVVTIINRNLLYDCWKFYH